MKCRICGALAGNAVTGCCTYCDSVIAWGMNELKRRGISEHVTLKQAVGMLHNGQMPQDVYDLYHDVWLISAPRFSRASSDIRLALNRVASMKREAENEQDQKVRRKGM